MGKSAGSSAARASLNIGDPLLWHVKIATEVYPRSDRFVLFKQDVFRYLSQNRQVASRGNFRRRQCAPRGLFGASGRSTLVDEAVRSSISKSTTSARNSAAVVALCS